METVCLMWLVIDLVFGNEKCSVLFEIWYLLIWNFGEIGRISFRFVLFLVSNFLGVKNKDTELLFHV